MFVDGRIMGLRCFIECCRAVMYFIAAPSCTLLMFRLVLYCCSDMFFIDVRCICGEATEMLVFQLSKHFYDSAL